MKLSLGQVSFAWLRQPVLALWFLYVALIPIYVGASGMPQPSNLLLIAILVLVVPRWNGRFDRAGARTLQALMLFTGWVCAVNYGWAAITGHYNLGSYVVFPFYYIFNAIVLFLALLLYRSRRDEFLRATMWAILFAITYQVVASFVYRSELYRDALFFNNPNQLGYWALLAACMVSLLSRPLGLGMLISGAAITGCAYLAVLSASRAAVAGIGILLVLLLFSSPKVVLAGAVAAIGLSSLGGPLSKAIDQSESRATADQHDGSFVEERGYDRLWEHKEHLLLGAGEGDLDRFTEEGGKRALEIHSSAATVLFSYGIIGAILFLIFVARVLAKAPLRLMLLLVPALAYTIAHQGLRFSMLWVVIAVFVALKTPTAGTSKVHAPTRAPVRA